LLDPRQQSETSSLQLGWSSKAKSGIWFARLDK